MPEKETTLAERIIEAQRNALPELGTAFLSRSRYHLPTRKKAAAVIDGVLAQEMCKFAFEGDGEPDAPDETDADLEAMTDCLRADVSALNDALAAAEAEIARLRAELAAMDNAFTTFTQWVQDRQSKRKALEGGDASE